VLNPLAWMDCRWSFTISSHLGKEARTLQAPYARSHALTIILGTTSEQIMCPTIGVVQLNESSGFGELKSLIKQNPTSQFGAGAEETEIA